MKTPDKIKDVIDNYIQTGEIRIFEDSSNYKKLCIKKGYLTSCESVVDGKTTTRWSNALHYGIK